MKAIKAVIDPVEDLLRGLEDAKAMYELGQEAGDAATIGEADLMLAELEKRGETVELQSLLDGPNDAQQLLFHDTGRGGRDRGAGLDGNAPAHVSLLL